MRANQTIPPPELAKDVAAWTGLILDRETRIVLTGVLGDLFDRRE